MKDPDYQQVKIAIDRASQEVYENFQEGSNTLLFVYYAGHGMMDNSTYCVLNGARMYPLEKQLRSLAKADGSYVVAVFDCCREKLKKKASRGFNPNEMKWNTLEDDSEWLGAPKGSQENFIVTYGCQPSDGVPQKS